MPNIYGNTEIWGDLLVTGSFSVLGSASSYNTTTLVVSNTILSLGASQTGFPILDQGILFTRGTGVTQSIMWDESDDTFSLVETDANEFTIGDIPILGYSNLRLAGLTAINISISGGASSGYILQSDTYGNANWVEPSLASTNIYNSNGGLNSDREIYGYGNYFYFDTNSPGYTSSTIGSYIYMTETQAEITAYSSLGGTSSKIRLLDTQIQSFAFVDGWLHNGDFSVFGGYVGINTAPTYPLHVIGTVSTLGFRMTNGAASGYLLQSDSSGNATWVSATSGSANFANTNLTLTGSRTHTIPSSNTLYIGQSSYVGPYLYLGGTNSGFSSDYTLLGYSNNFIDIDNDHNNLVYNNINRFSILSSEIVINETGGNYDFRVESGTDQNLFFIDASVDRIGVGTASPSAKLNLIGDSIFRTSTLTTTTSPSFRFLDGVTTPTDTTNIKSVYKEFRPTTTTSNTVVADGTIIYPNITSVSSAEFYASANLTLFNNNLSNLSSTEALTGEVNVISIYSNSGTYNGVVKSSSAVLENATAGGTIDKYVGFWANGLSADIVHNGTTNKMYGFYMDNQSGRSGNIPLSSNRWGIYIEDAGNNYFAGKIGIGVISPSYALEISGTVSTTGFRMTNGSSNGYFLKSNATGVGSWSQITASDITGLSGGLTGSGTTNYIPLWTGPNILSSTSSIFINNDNVGIGTTNPQNLLHVLGTNVLVSSTIYRKAWIGGAATWGSNSVEELGVGYNGLRSIFTGVDKWALAFSTGTSAAFNAGTQPERMRIDGDGNVGIGTSTPTVKLDVNGELNIANGNNLSWGGTYLTGNPTIAGSSAGINSYIAIYPQGSTSGEIVRITAAGSVGIGTISPNYRLEVSGTVSTTGLRLTTTPSIGYVLTSDASGNATWQPSTGSVDIYSTTQAFSAGVSYSVTHSLNTNNISVTVWEDTTGDLVTLSVKRLNVNQIQLLSRVSISSATIVVMGG